VLRLDPPKIEGAPKAGFAEKGIEKLKHNFRK
jgi:hypothetical protein